MEREYYVIIINIFNINISIFLCWQLLFSICTFFSFINTYFFIFCKNNKVTKKYMNELKDIWKYFFVIGVKMF